MPSLRRRYLGWGATDDELSLALPGDELVQSPHVTATRAITIAAPPEAVWPWIAQLGQGKGGFYSYDFLENLVGCGIHSADRIVAAWQAPAVGSEFLLHPEVALRVAELHPGSALVLEGGVAMGPIPPPYDFSWAFVVREGANRSTRLVVRERYRYTRRWSALLVEPVQVISFVMSERMLRGIRLRSQRAIAAEVEGESRPVG
jgi:hypothetical protein